MPVWFPSCHVRLGIRVEDFLPRTVVADTATTKGSGPEAFADAGFLPLGFDIVPLSAQVVINSYRKADTAKLQIPLARLPIDPRIVRQWQVQVFGGVISPSQQAKRARLMVGGKGDLVIGEDVDPVTGNSNEMFRGFAQRVKILEGDTEDDDTLEIEAQDVTSIFIGAELPEAPLRDIPKDARLDQVIQLLIYGDGVQVKDASRRFGLPGARGTVVVNETGVDPLPRLRDFLPPQYFNSAGKVGKGRKPDAGTKKHTYWDIIVEMVQAAGFKVYIREGRAPVTGPLGQQIIPGAELVITQPKSFFADNTVQILGGDVRRFDHGQTYNKMEMGRNYGSGDLPTAYEVRAWNPDVRKMMYARYPATEQVNRPGTTKKGDRQEISYHTLPQVGGNDAFDVLARTAVGLYEQRARNEIEISLKGDALSAFPGLPSRNPDGTFNAEVADMFYLRPGDRVELGKLPPRRKYGGVSTTLILDNLSENQRYNYLIQQVGMSPTLAQDLAAAMGSSFVQRFFRVDKIEWEWTLTDGGDSDGAWAWVLDLKNYIDTRNSTEALTDKCKTGYA